MSDPPLNILEPRVLAHVHPVSPTETLDTGRPPRRNMRVVGSGLRAWELLLVLAISTTAFLFWGGPLWDAQVGTSHVWRIGGSYLIVIPLVLAALARTHRLSLAHLLGAVGMVWSAKMLITATLYAYVAPESATQYAPARTWEGAQEPESNHREDQPLSMIAKEVATGDVAGVVVASDDREALAAVVVEDLPESHFARPRANVAIAIEHGRYGQSVYVAGPQDRIVLTNADASLHTLRVTQEHRAFANIPVPAGSREYAMATPLPGRYVLSCENHASEQALLIIVAHPFFTLTGQNGRFELPGVPAGEHVIVVLKNGHVPVRRTVSLAPRTRTELFIEMQ